MGHIYQCSLVQGHGCAGVDTGTGVCAGIQTAKQVGSRLCGWEEEGTQGGTVRLDADQVLALPSSVFRYRLRMLHLDHTLRDLTPDLWAALLIQSVFRGKQVVLLR